MKFVLGLVALVLVGLLLYVYTGKENKQPQKQTVHKTVKEVTPSKEEVIAIEKKVSETTKPSVQHTVKKESLKIEKTSNSGGEITKDLTLEGIENADVSDEEKVQMKDDMAYQQSLEPNEATINEEAILKIIDHDLHRKN